MLNSIEREYISISGYPGDPHCLTGHSIGTYIAYPKTQIIEQAVIVCMEIFGVNEDIKEVVDKLAMEGHFAIALDFYHRTEPGLALTYSNDDRARGLTLMNKLTRYEVSCDIKVCIDFLKKRITQKIDISILGFSIGGHIAYLAASIFPFKFSICFYAGWLTNTDILLSRPEPTIFLSKEIANNGTKVFFFVGSEDQLVTGDVIIEMENVWKKENVPYEMCVYQGVKHAFLFEGRPSFNLHACSLAWKKVIQILEIEKN